MITIKSDLKNYGINVPTSLSEVTPEILTSITKNINLPKYYCIIGLCFKTKVFDLVASINSNKDHSIQVTSILAKANKEDLNNINAEVGDKLIIEKSIIERGVHVSVPIMITANNFENYIKGDKELSKELTLNMEVSSKYIYLLEFKIIPVNEIKAATKIGSEPKDPFIYIPEEVKKELN